MSIPCSQVLGTKRSNNGMWRYVIVDRTQLIRIGWKKVWFRADWIEWDMYCLITIFWHRDHIFLTLSLDVTDWRMRADAFRTQWFRQGYLTRWQILVLRISRRACSAMGYTDWRMCAWSERTYAISRMFSCVRRRKDTVFSIFGSYYSKVGYRIWRNA